MSTEETTTLLFVGGTADGKRLRVRDDRNFYEVVVPGRTPLSRHPDTVVVSASSEVHRYRRERLSGGTAGRMRTVMLLDGLSPDDLIDNLVDNYPRSEA